MYPKPSKITIIKRKLFKYMPFLKVGLLLFALLLISLSALSFSKILKLAFQSATLAPATVYSAIFKSESDLKQKNGRTNFLLLGTGDGIHEGPNLTDTMIFLSIDSSQKDIFVLTIPRDIWSDALKDKINSAYAYGEEKKKGGGLLLSKAVVTEIINQPIHYAAKVNFTAFENLIDLLGGIDINVENILDDEKYPIPGKENEKCPDDEKEYKCRYTHIHFDKGLQHMDGASALKFVRSRYGKGVEGTDFARSNRQLSVLMAIKTKIFSLKTLTNKKLISEIIDTVLKNIDTDITPQEAVILGKTALKFQDTKIRHGILDWGDEIEKRTGLLTNPPLEEYDGAWVLVPRTGNWKEVQEYVKKEITERPTFTEPSPSPQ